MARLAQLATPRGTFAVSRNDLDEIAFALFDLAVAERASAPVPPPETSERYFHGTVGDWVGLPQPMPDKSVGYLEGWPTGIFASPDIESAEGVANISGGLATRPMTRIYEARIPKDRIYGGPRIHSPMPPGQDERDLYLPRGWGRLLDELAPHMDERQHGWDVREAIDAYIAADPSGREKLPSGWEAHIKGAKDIEHGGRLRFEDALEDHWSVEAEEIAAGLSVEDDHELLGGWT